MNVSGMPQRAHDGINVNGRPDDCVKRVASVVFVAVVSAIDRHISRRSYNTFRVVDTN